MELREYLFRNRVEVKQLAQELDYCRHHLSNIVNKKSFASHRLAKEIEKITNGQVTIPELINPERLKTKQNIAKSFG